jgi:hypothetical protein
MTHSTHGFAITGPRRFPYGLNHMAAISTAVIALLSASALAAPPAATPPNDPHNFEGTWTDLPAASPFLLGVDLPYKPEAQNIAADHLQAFEAGHTFASAHLTCRPTGVQGITSPKEAVLVMQTPEELIFISQEDREVRRIWLNSEHPKDLRPSYSGDAIGHWEGNTLVVDVVDFNGKGQLDEVGNPHSNQLHLVQRITKSPEGNTLTSVYSFTDPVFYTKPFTKTKQWRRSEGSRLLDYDCAENPRTDLFDTLTFNDRNASFKPTCVRPVNNGAASDKVVCTAPATTQPSK